MRQRWRWLLSVGAVTAVGASLLAQGSMAVAGTTGVARPAAVARAGAADQARAHRARGDAASARADAPAWKPVRKTLVPGMTGADVKKVQKRLKALKYYPGSIDGEFGPSMLEAVWAFKEVQGLRTRVNSDNIGTSMERRLAHPRAPRPVSSHHQNNRIDISLSHEYLVLYRHGKVKLISHVSTGGGYLYPCPGGGGGTCGPAITPTGNYKTLSFLPGWVRVPLGEMFNPTFFIGRAYAIHGDTVVPRTPASHGCVRIPMDIANFFHELVKIPGTPVYIRHN
jgi:lipoprotein-anchoring transpeptidase ErfK/SrfK